jgi:hypothetical protein
MMESAPTLRASLALLCSREEPEAFLNRPKQPKHQQIVPGESFGYGDSRLYLVGGIGVIGLFVAIQAASLGA